MDVVEAIENFVTNEDQGDDYEYGWGYELESRLSETKTEYDRDENGRYNWRNPRKVPNDPAIVPGFGRLFYVEGYEGGEGGGSDAYQVVKLVADDGSERYFRKEGYYASHHGTDWDGALFEVVPYTKTVTFYDKKA